MFFFKDFIFSLFFSCFCCYFDISEIFDSLLWFGILCFLNLLVWVVFCFAGAVTCFVGSRWSAHFFCGGPLNAAK